MWSAQLETLFAALCDCSVAERAVRLAELEDSDPLLRAELASLLSAADGAQGFLSTPAVAGAPAVSLVGERVGPYRLLQELGQGGMGAVYLAARDDGHFRQQVAVKLIRPGINAARLVRRFQTERQILADLRHPCIAGLLDGGSRDNGQPYLVLEYIPGQPLNVYCRHESLSLAARLRLFTQICGAVQYAHQQGVIHRDLKPGNILISPAGEPKLLDFGVAKLLNPVADGGAALTLMEPAPLTPAYAAPEQLRGETVTPATDVYALGLILREILTGSSGDASASAPPSSGSLPGGLDAIIARAAAHDPAHRYPSVAQLLDDLARCTAAVATTRKGRFYRWGGLLHRHRFPVALGGLAGLAGLALLVNLSMTPSSLGDGGSPAATVDGFCDGVLAQYRRSLSSNFLTRLTRCQLQAARRLNDDGHYEAALLVLSELRDEYQQHPGRRPRMLREQKGRLLAELTRAMQGDAEAP